MQRLYLTEQNDVVALAVDGVAPHGAVRENLEKRCELAFYGGDVAFIQWHPLGDDAAGPQVLLDELEILL